VWLPSYNAFVKTGPRPPFRNNSPLVLLWTAAALALFVGVQLLLRKSRDFAPDFLASVLLYGLIVLNISLLLVLVLFLGRNLVRVVMERRRRVLGARFRMRLLLVFILMAAAPALLLMLVGSDLIRQTVDRWFNVDVERIVSSLQTLGSSVRNAHLDHSRMGAEALARDIQAGGLLEAAGQGRLRRTVEARARDLRLDVVSVLSPDGELLAVVSPRLPSAENATAAGEELAQAALSGRPAETMAPFAGGEMARVAVPVRDREGGVRGAVVVSTFVPVAVAAEVREVEERYTKYRKAESFKEPIKAVYLSLYLFPALVILFGAVWLSLYLARRITTPLRLVAEGAERIASGERGVRVDFPSGDDEFTALIASFNRMSERLARSEEEVEHTRAGLTRKNRELEDHQQLLETVFDAVGTGLVAVDAEGTIARINNVACKLLEIDPAQAGRPLADALTGPGEAIAVLVARQLAGRGARQKADVVLAARGQDRHLTVTVVPLPGPPGSPPGAVAVVDDRTPIIQAEKVQAWSEVARKLAHEIKNPLTPIQLSAQRIRRAHFRNDPDFEKVLRESTAAIVDEVDALKNLVDEFAQYARMPSANLAPGSLHEVIDQALSLYDGLFSEVTVERRLAPDLPAVRLDSGQMKRVVINLVDNAIEATGRKGTVTISTEFDRGHGRVRLGVADDGPGIDPADRDKLFVPHFSTKKRGSGLGLAIVNRIVQDHSGEVRVEANQPKGVRFVVELPA
jgi:two-component system nitrogen regulation sensor histidine kinase NtrY